MNVLSFPCQCGHFWIDHDPMRKILIYNERCRSCFCIEYKRDNLMYLEYKLKEKESSHA